MPVTSSTASGQLLYMQTSEDQQPQEDELAKEEQAQGRADEFACDVPERAVNYE